MALIVRDVSLGQGIKGDVIVLLIPQNDATRNISQIKVLRPRLSERWHAWFNEEALLAAANTRAKQKKYLLYIIGERLKPKVQGTRAVIPRSELMALLHKHRDCRNAPSHEARRKWVMRTIKLLEKLPMVTVMGNNLLLDEFNIDHGSDTDIDAHHAKAAHIARHKAADRARKYRDSVSGISAADALKSTSQPLKQIVTVLPKTPLTTSRAKPYNASIQPPKPSPPKQALGFAPTGPKRAAAVSAKQGIKSPSPLPAITPGFETALASIWPRSGKPLAQPSIAPQPFRASWANPAFDPRSNCKAARIFGRAPVSDADVRLIATSDKTLKKLRLKDLRSGATVETLFAAHHLYLNRPPGATTHPVRWISWAEKALRCGNLRYAGDVFTRSMM